MAEEFVKTENGNIKISDDVIVRISAISAREVEGIAGLGTTTGWGDLLGKKLPAKGVKVEYVDGATIIEVHVTVKFGVKINEVAYKLQETVKNAVESYAGLDNITVNVFVDGIEMDNGKDKSEDDEEEKDDWGKLWLRNTLTEEFVQEKPLWSLTTQGLSGI